MERERERERERYRERETDTERERERERERGLADPVERAVDQRADAALADHIVRLQENQNHMFFLTDFGLWVQGLQVTSPELVTRTGS